MHKYFYSSSFFQPRFILLENLSKKFQLPSNKNEYLLHAEGEKRELFFRRNKIFFYGKTQREFSYLTSEASLVSEFKLSFAIKKDFVSSKKKFTFFTFSMQQILIKGRFWNETFWLISIHNALSKMPLHRCLSLFWNFFGSLPFIKKLKETGVKWGHSWKKRRKFSGLLQQLLNP